MQEAIHVFKLSPDGSVKLSYDGTVIERTETHVKLRAPWTRGEYPLGYVTFEPGDVFVEYYYADRWYNVFEIYAAGGGFKGWYCNITRPARLLPGEVRAEDLALDVWVWPDRRVLILDEDEFEQLALPEAEARTARETVTEIERRVRERLEPFTDPPASG